MLSCPMNSKFFMDKAHGRIDSIFATNFLIGIFWLIFLMSFFNWRKNGRFLF